MSTIKFHEYCGLAGDIHMLLVGTDEEGNRHGSLFSRNFFENYNKKRAKKRIIKMFESDQQSTNGTYFVMEKDKFIEALTPDEINVLDALIDKTNKHHSKEECLFIVNEYWRNNNE
jgi:hypothetical protein